jgi:hypothetical protein
VLPSRRRDTAEFRTRVREHVETKRLRLSQTHPRGRHKARVFLTALDLTTENAEELQSALLESVKTGEAVIGTADEFGIRYTVDFDMTRLTTRARVRGIWIIRRDDGIPRLLSCYVL